MQSERRVLEQKVLEQKVSERQEWAPWVCPPMQVYRLYRWTQIEEWLGSTGFQLAGVPIQHC